MRKLDLLVIKGLSHSGLVPGTLSTTVPGSVIRR